MPTQDRATALTAFLLRVALGVVFLAHSVLLKLLAFGLPGTAAFFRSVGLPGWLAHATVAAEVVGGLMLVLGVRARLAAAALAPIPLGAVFAVHAPNGWVFTAAGGGWGYPAYLFVLCVARALLGEGAFALRPSALPGFGGGAGGARVSRSRGPRAGEDAPMLVSHHLCPYVQRAATAADEKGIALRREFIDLSAKPDWFLALSPTGKVPLLRVGGAVLFESAVTCEYLDETSPGGPTLLPADPLERARHRAWVEFASATLGDVAGLSAAGDEAAFVAMRSALAGRFAAVGRALAAEGP